MRAALPDQILQALEDGPATVAALATRLGMDGRFLGAAVQSLRRRHLIHPIERQQYATWALGAGGAAIGDALRDGPPAVRGPHPADLAANAHERSLIEQYRGKGIGWGALARIAGRCEFDLRRRYDPQWVEP